ncbi:hypothetical protein BU23DRAFT_298123 [Bimuria novae-zelandiae CBS 107.79]|uniref:Uncharacterized protein n=1 Tax=Bimuria novae-zelandiae CBS 107.79 TaxID=1447943 RepID=A0A6A5VLZ8_9PLEO|nr:hypothetical protein BU23DRAFT_298123 [Bimuria novae-zelandiae CBS 107.79]
MPTQEGATEKSGCSPRIPNESELEIKRLIALKEKESAMQHTSPGGTVYHIYPVKGKSHVRITATADAKQEHLLRRAWRKARKAHKAKEQREVNDGGITTKAKATAPTDSRSSKPQTVEVAQESISEKEDDVDAFYLHAPFLSPQTLYRGNSNKNPSTPLVLIHSSFLWRTYKLHYGTSLEAHKPRPWCPWRRRTQPSVQTSHTPRASSRTPSTQISQTLHDSGVAHLHWSYPFSRRTREYHFSYATLQFAWKGTRAPPPTATSKRHSFCRHFVRFNHLKLIAVLPSAEGRSAEEVCLARYTSSLSSAKHGRLEVFDEEAGRLYEAHVWDERGEWAEEERVEKVKRTTLYPLVVATAVCMVRSEKAKREVVGKWIKDAAEGAEGG